jgi:hypothetical protein
MVVQRLKRISMLCKRCWLLSRTLLAWKVWFIQALDYLFACLHFFVTLFQIRASFYFLGEPSKVVTPSKSRNDEDMDVESKSAKKKDKKDKKDKKKRSSKG